jgi:hypothetical protein
MTGTAGYLLLAFEAPLSRFGALCTSDPRRTGDLDRLWLARRRPDNLEVDQNSISWNRLASWLLRRRIHAEYGKQSLRAGDLAEARGRFRKANGPHAGCKIHAINAALRFISFRDRVENARASRRRNTRQVTD